MADEEITNEELNRRLKQWSPAYKRVLWIFAGLSLGVHLIAEMLNGTPTGQLLAATLTEWLPFLKQLDKARAQRIDSQKIYYGVLFLVGMLPLVAANIKEARKNEAIQCGANIKSRPHIVVRMLAALFLLFFTLGLAYLVLGMSGTAMLGNPLFATWMRPASGGFLIWMVLLFISLFFDAFIPRPSMNISAMKDDGKINE